MTDTTVVVVNQELIEIVVSDDDPVIIEVCEQGPPGVAGGIDSVFDCGIFL